MPMSEKDADICDNFKIGLTQITQDGSTASQVRETSSATVNCVFFWASENSFYPMNFFVDGGEEWINLTPIL